MRTGRPKLPLSLTESQRQQLESLAHRSRSRPLLARRARVVLACAEGLDNQTVARKLLCAVSMVGPGFCKVASKRWAMSHGRARPQSERRASRAGRHPDLGKYAARRDTLVHS